MPLLLVKSSSTGVFARAKDVTHQTYYFSSFIAGQAVEDECQMRLRKECPGLLKYIQACLLAQVSWHKTTCDSCTNNHC